MQENNEKILLPTGRKIGCKELVLDDYIETAKHRDCLTDKPCVGCEPQNRK